jgi:hypothetical protein
MGKRGPKSALELTVVKGGFGERPEPPEDLTEAQATIWQAVAASEPEGFFNTSVVKDLLADYCRHRSSADMLSATLNQFQPEWLKSAAGSKRYQMLIAMREKETGAAARCATKLRLTNQSRYTPQAAATAAKNAASATPWDFK